LAERLLTNARENNPGLLVLNPCSFARRVVVELAGGSSLASSSKPVHACQIIDGKVHAVVDVPAFGFTWLPACRGLGAAQTAARMPLASDNCVRNEFLEAEIDAQTGGLRGLRDVRTRVNQIGQQLVFNPGSTMRASEIRMTSSGPALGEIV